MVVVSPTLIQAHLDTRKARRVFNLLERSSEIQTYLKMANIMAVTRLKYNDHGPVHSRITAGSALEMLKIISDNIQPTSIRDHGLSYEDAKIITLCGAYLHDIGNAIHRKGHNLHGCYIVNSILENLLSKVYSSRETLLKVKCEILHCIYAHDEDIQCLSIEAGIVKVADGTDMAEGRARVPYDLGKVDMHSLSALAIRRVEIVRGSERPIRLIVHMDNPAGIFQIDHVLRRKIETSGIKDQIEVIAIENGRELKVFRG
ncbi:MAG: HD domain-containing protein [archaeon GB-1867-005]|nr:HD domain-containing protein [Candidatus Culexmicrobium cathedralense]